MKSSKKVLFISLIFLALLSRSRAYVTSAVLEYTGDDKCGAYLNGRELLNLSTSDFQAGWWNCLSTSDGTLPLDLFKNNADNVLGLVNYDVFGGDINCAFRLTVHQSKGDPIVTWVEPGKTKFLNVPHSKPLPVGWYLPYYDDREWRPAVQMIWQHEDYWNIYQMEDHNFDGFFGAQKGYVPYLSHSSNGATNPLDRDLYRVHFSFPNYMGKATMLMNPPKASAGQQVAFRLLPSNDAADFSSYRAFVNLPQGLEPVRILDNGVYDPQTRRIEWNITNSAASTRYISLCAESVLSAPGWDRPDKALGPYKPYLRESARNVAPLLLANSAVFFTDSPGWFKISNSGIQDGPNAPRILGLIFRGQCTPGGSDSYRHRGAAQLYINYSTDHSLQGFLNKDAQFSHSGTPHREDGYYDASEDRRWTWKDVNNLQVKIESKVTALRQQGSLANVRVIVRAFYPQQLSPAFLGKVVERSCKELVLNAGVIDMASGMNAMDPYPLPVNQHLCPTATPLPQPNQVAAAQPTAVPTHSLVDLNMGCLQSSPEPFKRGGVFVYFCLNAPASISFQVYNSAHQLVRSIPAGDFRAGKNQIFFNGQSDQGIPLPPGTYTYQFKAAAEGAATKLRNSSFTKVADETIR